MTQLHSTSTIPMSNLELPVIDPTCAHNMALYWEGGMTYRIVKHPRRRWEIEQVTFDEVAMDAARGRCDDN